MKLDRSRPFGQTFGAEAGALPIFQDNVYFNVRGDVVDCPYNRANSPHLFVRVDTVEPITPPDVVEPIAANVPGAPVEAPVIPPDASKADIADILAGKTDAEIYTAAVKLRAMLDETGDADAFVPDPGDKSLNIGFLLRHGD
jgi:hypothetical protein